MTVYEYNVEHAVTDLLLAIGEDPTREGLKDTPKRVARFWKEFIEYQPGNTETLFEAIQSDQMVVCGPITTWSLCEHHLLPFSTDIWIGYLSAAHVIGLSKLARIAHQHAHRLQLQERLIDDIATHLIDALDHNDVAVYGTGQHLCMAMRGIKEDTRMATSSLNGRFRTEPETRSEFLNLTRLQIH